jgi:hypothetical protein
MIELFVKHKKLFIGIAISILVITVIGVTVGLILHFRHKKQVDNINGIYIFSPGDDVKTQSIIDAAFKTQGGSRPENNGQNSLLNYAFLFMPGSYNVNIPIGYYTHVAGLGKTNDKVIINGGPTVHNSSGNPAVGALNNFWRTCENMTVNPKNPQDTVGKVDGPSNTMIYAVSQASSLRSVNINGLLHMGAMTSLPDNKWDMGFASGGFMANCKIVNDLNMGSQQQFICRNTEYGFFPTCLWNHVNLGCKGTNASFSCLTKNASVTNNLTIVNETPKVFEKPYLAVSNNTDKNSIIVMIPGQSNSIGNTNVEPTDYITKDNYKIIGTNSSANDINELLLRQEIKCLIFSPGRYNLDSPIQLNGKLLFGLGIPVLRSTNHNSIIKGYGKLCGFVFEAGPLASGMNNDIILVNLEKGNPSYLWDIACRVGGGDKNNDVYSIDTMLYVGGDNSILDNIWCWVADHYANNEYTLWDKAICNIGVHVTGNNVYAYGLFSEHSRKRNVFWEGDKGEVYMFQSEFNYFPPSQDDFNDSISYEVSNKVSSHIIRGAGAYSFFPNTQVPRESQIPPSTEIFAKAGFYFPSTVDYEMIVTVFLNGYGGIKNCINNDGNIVKYVPPSIPNTSVTQVYTTCTKQ